MEDIIKQCEEHLKICCEEKIQIYKIRAEDLSQMSKQTKPKDTVFSQVRIVYMAELRQAIELSVPAGVTRAMSEESVQEGRRELTSTRRLRYKTYILFV